MWKILMVVTGAGAAGGILNALVSGAGFILPHLAVVAGSNVLAPGFIGNVLAGAVAALLSFGLYGPFSTMSILGASQSPPSGSVVSPQLTLAALAGAVLVGFSGGRWITAESDRQLNHGTAVATSQLAETLAASKMGATAPGTQASSTPPVTHQEVQSLALAVRTRSPLEAYEQATKLGQAPQ
jgi:hypothetical protein